MESMGAAVVGKYRAQEARILVLSVTQNNVLHKALT
jgi:hypothetical protein